MIIQVHSTTPKSMSFEVYAYLHSVNVKVTLEEKRIHSIL